MVLTTDQEEDQSHIKKGLIQLLLQQHPKEMQIGIEFPKKNK